MKLAAFILSVCISASFGQTLAQKCLSVSASDLTNINKSEYIVTGDPGGIDDGEDMCKKSGIFRLLAGSYACRKPIIATVSIENSYDGTITVSSTENTLVCCEEKKPGCHVYSTDGTFIVDTEEMRKDGFVPDPGITR